MRRGADRIRKVADAEEMAYQEAPHREYERRQREAAEAASAAGYQSVSVGDPFPPKQCPICGAAVSLSGVPLHIAWHEGRGA